MPIKDKSYWKEYNQRRKTYIQQKNKERYLSKGCINTPETDTTENNTTFNTTLPINTTEPIQPINTTPEKLIQPIQPKAELIQPLKCSRCPEIENSISEFANLYQQEQEKNKELTKELKNSQQAIQEAQKEVENSQQVIQEQSKLLTEQKQQEERLLKEKTLDKQTISNLTNKNNSLIQNLTDLKNQAKNNNNSLSIPDLNNLIFKHTKIQNSQHRYSEKDTREREFLKSLLDKLWQFN